MKGVGLAGFVVLTNGLELNESKQLNQLKRGRFFFLLKNVVIENQFLDLSKNGDGGGGLRVMLIRGAARRPTTRGRGGLTPSRRLKTFEPEGSSSIPNVMIPGTNGAYGMSQALT